MQTNNGKARANGDTLGKSRPPRFEEAKNRRQKIRSAGLDPNYWYAVLQAPGLKKGQVQEVFFWKQSIALFRDEEGTAHAIENRCAHRQLRLSEGKVEGCNLVCTYHGWAYNGGGRVVEMKHDLFGKAMPRVGVASYPVRERYGLIWIFPGAPELADSSAMPEIPELEGPDRWACVPIEYDLNCHHSMIIDNVSDFTHAYLHRRFKPFWNAKMTQLEVDDEHVLVGYDTKVGGGRISQYFVDRKEADTSHITLCYQYPYQWSNTDDFIKHWCFVTPIDERTTKTFFLFYFKSLKVPLLPLRIPRWLMQPVLQVANKVMVRPLLGEDAWAVQEEQIGWERHWDKPIAEINPAVHEFQKLAIRKWETHLERGKTRPAPEPCASNKSEQKAPEASSPAKPRARARKKASKASTRRAGT